MDEEKPFPIEWVILLMIVALANDIAEIFFDLLDFTGIGIAGEAIMEPIDFVLDFFFTGIFVWKLGFGGGTITQYVDDILEPLLIPGRTISVGIGIWVANHPKSVVSTAANMASSLESGGVSGKLSAAKDAAGAADSIATDASGRRLVPGQEGEGEFEGISADQQTEGKLTDTRTDDSMQGREEKNPMENLEDDLYAPAYDSEEIENPMKKDAADGALGATATAGKAGKYGGKAIKATGEKAGETVKKGSEAAGKGLSSAAEGLGEVPYVGPALQAGGEAAGKTIEIGGRVAGEAIKQSTAAVGKGVESVSSAAESGAKKVQDIRREGKAEQSGNTAAPHDPTEDILGKAA